MTKPSTIFCLIYCILSATSYTFHHDIILLRLVYLFSKLVALSYTNSDIQKFAMKANAMEIGGKWQDVFKDPITDSGKTSKKGVLSLVRSTGIGNSQWRTIRRSELCLGEIDNLVKVFENGELLVDQTFDQIRSRAGSPI